MPTSSDRFSRSPSSSSRVSRTSDFTTSIRFSVCGLDSDRASTSLRCSSCLASSSSPCNQEVTTAAETISSTRGSSSAAIPWPSVRSNSALSYAGKIPGCGSVVTNCSSSPSSTRPWATSCCKPIRTSMVVSTSSMLAELSPVERSSDPARRAPCAPQ